MNIDEMQAGRELDALIAERVMENRVDNVHGNLMEVGQTFADDLLNYSTDITAAWRVVAKICERCAGSAELDGWQGEDGIIRSRFRIFVHPSQSPIGAIANTSPLAICRAALKVVGA